MDNNDEKLQKLYEDVKELHDELVSEYEVNSTDDVLLGALTAYKHMLNIIKARL